MAHRAPQQREFWYILLDQAATGQDLGLLRCPHVVFVSDRPCHLPNAARVHRSEGTHRAPW